MKYKDKLESDDITSTLKTIISAVDVEKLKEEDRDKLVDELEPDSEGKDEDGLGSEVPGETKDTNAPPEEDMGEMDGTKALEELIGMPFDDDYSTSDEYYDDDDDDDLHDIEDKKASSFAKHDFERENPSDEIEPDDNDLNKEMTHKKRREEEEEEFGEGRCICSWRIFSKY